MVAMPSDFPHPLAEGNRLHDCVRTWAALRPHADAAVEPGRRLSHAALRDTVDACAAAMIAAGVERGDRVATLAVPGVDFMVTFLATAAIGGVWVGLNPRYTAPELDAIIARIEPKLVFTAGVIGPRSYCDWAAALPAAIVVVDLDGECVSTDRPVPFPGFLATGVTTAQAQLQRRYANTRPDDPCLIVFTSGSTGTPKGAMISHAALVGTSRVQLHTWPAEPLRVLDNLPINHIGCVGDLCCYALVGGGTVVFTPRFDPAASLAAIRDEQVTVWGQVPTMFQLTLDAPEFDPSMLASLQLVFWGGAHATPELVARLRGLAPRIATSYSQTETVGSVTFTRADADASRLAHTVGRAVPPYEVRVVDDEGRPLATGGEGEIQVRTPFGMNGYWRDPQATAAVMTADGWQRTGDVGALTKNGDLRLLGRVHDVFKSGGYNIHPPEIEAALSAHPAIVEASVVGVPDAVYGTVAVAFITCQGTSPSAEELRSALRERLANYKIPKRFIAVDELPRLPVGKIDKQALRALAVAP
jgi:acyl-CoA synthetase (AMP-forming)/AMP-acid ligase II